jgi:DNA-binding HxlR family transcriptional regulator/putative sterol carrier protein
MTESNWKVAVDRDRLTISSDTFTFTTTGTDPLHLEAVVADLQSAVRETYGQYCGLSRAAEMVGERWGFLIVRDLLNGPKSAEELHKGLPRMSLKLVERRLKELAYSGVVQPVDETDDEGTHYELTEYGSALEEAVLAFGRWGAATLAMPRSEDIITDDSLMVALKATFLPDKARDVRLSYELHIGERHVIHVRIDDGKLEVGNGPLPEADAVLDVGFVLLALMTGEMTAADVLDTGQVRVEGDPALLERFVGMFQLPKLPAPKVYA